MQLPIQDRAFWERFAEDLYVRDMPTAELCVSQLAPSTFGRIRSREGLPEVTEGHGAAHDYLLALQLAEIPFIEQLLAAKKVSTGSYPAGGVSVIPFEERPRIFLPGSFDTLIVRITQVSLDEIAYSHRIPRVDRLSQTFGRMDSVVHNLGQVLVSTLQQPNHASKFFVDHVLHALNCHLAFSYGGIPPVATHVRGGLTARQVKRAAEFLDAHLDGDIDLRQIADTCSLSVSHFTRAFKQTFGKPPYRWLIERRVDKARDLMANSRLSIADIAMQCGFADQSGFNRSFKRIHGVTPGIWRRTVVN
ncbi:helix-turn-helix transcriptional regulator [Terriglobus roseus]|uniref:Transcriptional regulator, AraC family n=1 Tax=Terriglobus roseus TaxID=392734 RepID=A0A1G7H732_9BACT|nr:AraC family transcriptional regulator [Terriglobus roseus]SDE96216.1 transcriptional regulator, AraC family [Terriglobus roseus]